MWETAKAADDVAVPLGMGLLALQCLAQILALLTRRAAPFAGGGEPS